MCCLLMISYERHCYNACHTYFFLSFSMKLSLLAAAASAVIAATITLPAFAAPNAKMMKRSTMTVDAACMGAAVTARDSAISTALSDVVTAIQTRGQALAAAWANTDPAARQAAVKAAD